MRQPTPAHDELRPIRSPAEHPGRVLDAQILRPAGISQNALARMMGVPPRRFYEIVLGKRAITAQTALLLEEVLGFPAEYWMAYQVHFDLEVARGNAVPRPKSSRAPDFDWVSFETGDDAARHEEHADHGAGSGGHDASRGLWRLTSCSVNLSGARGSFV